MPDLSTEALEAKFADEDAADAARPDVPPSQRDITTFDGFASGGATPRSLGEDPTDGEG